MVCKRNQCVDRGGGSPMTRTPVASAAKSVCGHAAHGCPGRPGPTAHGHRGPTAYGHPGHRGPTAYGQPDHPAHGRCGHPADGQPGHRGPAVLPPGPGGQPVPRRPAVTRESACAQGSVVSREPARARGLADRPAVVPCRPGLARPARPWPRTVLRQPRRPVPEHRLYLYLTQRHAATLYDWSFDPGRDILCILISPSRWHQWP